METLWLIRFKNPKGEWRFGCRQTSGPAYKILYEWLAMNGYVCSSDDWPWDYFYFPNINDQLRFEQVYGAAIRNEEF